MLDIRKPHFPYIGHDRGVVVTQPRNGEFEERLMTAGELGARETALEIAKDIHRHACQAGVCYVEIWELISKAIDEATQSAKRTTIPIKVRPMLVSGQLATDENGPMILIDSEQDEHEQVVALWHETLHLLGMTDEGAADRIAERLAGACPTVLRGLTSNINVQPAPLGGAIVSTAFKCDLCDAIEEFKPGTVRVEYHVTEKVDDHGAPTQQGYELDLCSACSKKVLDVLKHYDG